MRGPHTTILHHSHPYNGTFSQPMVNKIVHISSKFFDPQNPTAETRLKIRGIAKDDILTIIKVLDSNSVSIPDSLQAILLKHAKTVLQNHCML